MKYSQEKFGELAGVSQRTVAFWEAGERMPSHTIIVELADRLDMSVDYLLGRSDEKRPENTQKKQPTVSDDELKQNIISQIQVLPDPALTRVADCLSGLQAGQAVAEAEAAAPDPAEAPAE